MHLTKRFLFAIALVGAPLTVRGQVAEFGVSGGGSLLSNNSIGSLTPDGSTPLSLGNGLRITFRGTFNTQAHFGHEVGYAYNRAQLNSQGAKAGMAIHQGFYDFLAYATPEGSKVRPFAAGGVQFSNFIPPGASVTQGGGSTKFGFNYGGGVKVRVSSRFLVRFDLRQYMNGKPFGLYSPSGLLRQTEVSAGFSITM